MYINIYIMKDKLNKIRQEIKEKPFTEKVIKNINNIEPHNLSYEALKKFIYSSF